MCRQIGLHKPHRSCQIAFQSSKLSRPIVQLLAEIQDSYILPNTKAQLISLSGLDFVAFVQLDLCVPHCWTLGGADPSYAKLASSR